MWRNDNIVCVSWLCCFFFFQAEDGIRDLTVTGVQTCALPIYTQCPYAATNVCHIALQWNKTISDTSGAGVAVDTYTLLRERRIQGANGSFEIGRASCRERG